MALCLLPTLAFLAGCSGGTAELSKQQDAELRHNFARELTPEERANFGSGPSAAPKDAPTKPDAATK